MVIKCLYGREKVFVEWEDGNQVTAKETVIVRESSWCDKMMGLIVVTSSCESTCCSVNDDGLQRTNKQPLQNN